MAGFFLLLFAFIIRRSTFLSMYKEWMKFQNPPAVYTNNLVRVFRFVCFLCLEVNEVAALEGFISLQGTHSQQKTSVRGKGFGSPSHPLGSPLDRVSVPAALQWLRGVNSVCGRTSIPPFLIPTMVTADSISPPREGDYKLFSSRCHCSRWKKKSIIVLMHPFLLLKLWKCKHQTLSMWQFSYSKSLLRDAVHTMKTTAFRRK